MADANKMREALEGLLWYVKQLEMIVYPEDDTGTHEAVALAQIALAEQPAQGDEPNRGQLKPHDGGSIAPGYTAPPAQGGPTCPHCKTVMRPVHFVGYYDEFHFWSCDCEILPNAVKERGGYA